jgi:hypothetical protein
MLHPRCCTLERAVAERADELVVLRCGEAREAGSIDAALPGR